MKIEVVSHCWARDLPHFADALCYQLSSLVLDRPKKCEVSLTVCCSPWDYNTTKVLNFFSSCGVRVKTITLNIERLGRRCIGRNVAAVHSDADLVWFCDADHLFRDGLFDRLAEFEWRKGVAMIYPKRIKIHRDHVTGDRVTSLIRHQPRIAGIDPTLFMDKKYNRAIGGVQIVKGDFARKHGYLNDDIKWQQPRTDGRPFGDFRDDLAYRTFCGRHGKIVGVNLPGLYRIRHSRTTYQPDKV